MGQTGPREIGANLAFGVNLALFILQCIEGKNCINMERSNIRPHTSLASKETTVSVASMHFIFA